MRGSGLALAAALGLAGLAQEVSAQASDYRLCEYPRGCAPGLRQGAQAGNPPGILASDLAERQAASWRRGGRAPEQRRRAPGWPGAPPTPGAARGLALQRGACAGRATRLRSSRCGVVGRPQACAAAPRPRAGAAAPALGFAAAGRRMRRALRWPHACVTLHAWLTRPPDHSVRALATACFRAPLRKCRVPQVDGVHGEHHAALHGDHHAAELQLCVPPGAAPRPSQRRASRRREYPCAAVLTLPLPPAPVPAPRDARR